MSRVFFDRTQPYGFVRVPGFYAEAVEIENGEQYVNGAENARRLDLAEQEIRGNGLTVQAQAEAMVEFFVINEEEAEEETVNG